jgi:hypothetical protein
MWRCGLSDDEEEVAAPSVPEDDVVVVPPTVPEDKEVGGVVHLNRPHASHICMAALGPSVRYRHSPANPRCGPAVRRCRSPGSPRCDRLSWRPLDCLAALLSHPIFPKETKCKPICMPGSSFMHIVTYKCIQKQYHVKKKGDYQRFTLYPGNEGSKHHRQSTGGCVLLAPATSS